MTDLVAAIRAAIDETEQVAQSASGWGASGRIWRRDLVSCVEDGDGRLIVYGEGTPTSAEADHIARHDPAAVLRRCAADRKIVARHLRGVLADYECGQCGDPWPCGDLRALAEGYGVEDIPVDKTGPEIA